MGALLSSINSPEDLKKLDIGQVIELSSEIRHFLVENVSRTGGHLASNLGVVELTLALHRVYDSPRDKIIWDVGHQSYVHKILTGRKRVFHTLREMEGISGFPKTSESCHDCFNTGHSSTSISAALGMARARDIKGEKYSVIAVIGDGALTGGMAFEALNDAGRSSTNITVILNDNEMSIANNVGGLSRYLSRIRTGPIYYRVKEDIDILLNKIPGIGKSAAKALDLAKGTIKYILTPGILFEELGLKYIGPIDGHNYEELEKVLARAKNAKGPVLIHVCTQKGKGYQHAEENPHTFHGVPPFEIDTGVAMAENSVSYSQVFGDTIIQLAKQDERIVAITAAMPDGTGLSDFAETFRNRFFDVGIAEQHAVTLAAGLASGGLIPVVAIYSTFLQRAYDQILHDVALQNLHVVFCIDRAGIVGEDGETHQGIYDLSFLRHIPNMTVMAPCDYSEFRQMLDFAVFSHGGPVAVRYPKGKGREKLIETRPVRKGKGLAVIKGRDVTLAVVGSMVETAVNAAGALERLGISAEVLHCRFVKPLDEKLIIESVLKTGRILTIEDNVVSGGFGSAVLELLSSAGIKAEARVMGFPDDAIPHGRRDELFRKYRLDAGALTDEVLRFLKTTRAV